jgi:hypothetical protein
VYIKCHILSWFPVRVLVMRLWEKNCKTKTRWNRSEMAKTHNFKLPPPSRSPPPHPPLHYYGNVRAQIPTISKVIQEQPSVGRGDNMYKCWKNTEIPELRPSTEFFCHELLFLNGFFFLNLTCCHEICRWESLRMFFLYYPDVISHWTAVVQGNKFTDLEWPKHFL